MDTHKAAQSESDSDTWAQWRKGLGCCDDDDDDGDAISQDPRPAVPVDNYG